MLTNFVTGTAIRADDKTLAIAPRTDLDSLQRSTSLERRVASSLARSKEHFSNKKWAKGANQAPPII